MTVRRTVTLLAVVALLSSYPIAQFVKHATLRIVHEAPACVETAVVAGTTSATKDAIQAWFDRDDQEGLLDVFIPHDEVDHQFFGNRFMCRALANGLDDSELDAKNDNNPALERYSSLPVEDTTSDLYIESTYYWYGDYLYNLDRNAPYKAKFIIHLRELPGARTAIEVVQFDATIIHGTILAFSIGHGTFGFHDHRRPVPAAPNESCKLLDLIETNVVP